MYSAKSSAAAVRPPTFTSISLPTTLGITSSRRRLTRSAVALSCGSVVGNTCMIATSPVERRLRRRGERHAFDAVVQRLAQLLQRGDVLLTIRRGRGEQQRSVETGPEPLGDEVVGTAGGVAGGTVPGVVETEAQRQQRHREQEEKGEPDDQRGPRVVLDHAAPPVPGGLATGRSGARVTTDLPLVDVAPGEAEQRGQERDRREHGGEHTGRDRDGHAAHDRRLHEPQAEHRDDHGGSREQHRAAGGVDRVHDAPFGVETGGRGSRGTA